MKGLRRCLPLPLGQGSVSAFVADEKHRDESRRGKHECLRHRCGLDRFSTARDK
jgi:hypothetical protein